MYATRNKWKPSISQIFKKPLISLSNSRTLILQWHGTWVHQVHTEKKTKNKWAKINHTRGFERNYGATDRRTQLLCQTRLEAATMWANLIQFPERAPGVAVKRAVLQKAAISGQRRPSQEQGLWVTDLSFPRSVFSESSATNTLKLL